MGAQVFRGIIHIYFVKLIHGLPIQLSSIGVSVNLPDDNGPLGNLLEYSIYLCLDYASENGRGPSAEITEL